MRVVARQRTDQIGGEDKAADQDGDRDFEA